MPPPFYVPILVAGMIITGSSNSLWSKWQDMQCVENCQDSDPANHVLYEQPVWQTLQMFLGEMLCFLPVAYTALRAHFSPSAAIALEQDDVPHLHAHTQPKPLTGARVLLLWLPAACDLTGTTLMNVGLLYTPVSIYQMTRGALVLFVGVLSVLFLKRKLWLYQWLSLITVMAGVSLVGLSGSMVKDAIKDTVPDQLVRWIFDPATEQPTIPTDGPEPTTVLVGVFFILFAQIFTATQFVVEEKIMSRYSVSPLVAVGYEGLFGALTILLFMPILALPSMTKLTPFFDLPRGWHQMVDNAPVLYSGIAIAISISLFNFFGLSVTRHISATARSLTDTCRTLSIWLISLGLGWEVLVWPISLLQVAGFGLLVYGTFVFNNLVRGPAFLMPKPEEKALLSGSAGEDGQDEEQRALLDETARIPADLGQGGYDVVPPQERRARTSDRADSSVGRSS